MVCREVVWHRRCAGCGWGEFFLGGVVRGLGIEAVLDRVWCFCVIFKFIFGVFWIIIMEKDGWPDWLPDCLIDWLIDIRSFGDCFVGLERRASDVC